MEVFVFDLDFTLWNTGDTWCSETKPPYVWDDRKLYDQEKRWIRLYPDTIEVLKTLSQQQKIIVAASRTYEPEWANDLLEIFDIDKYFDVKEIYPGSKIRHMEKIQKQITKPYSQFVFFDDEQRNVNEVETLGVKSVKIDNGISLKTVCEFLI